MARRTPPADGGSRGKSPGISRRRLLGAAAASVAAPYIVPATSLAAPGRAAPSDRIAIGSIGVGGRGSGHLRTFLGYGETQVVAVCDADRRKADANKQRADARYGGAKGTGGGRKGCAACTDFREIISRDDVDAVVIASPENWHALQAAMACEAGKDVYCEKALSLTVAEGRALCEAVRRYGRVFQVGTQQRSGRNFRYACELARNGYLGELQRVEVGVPGGRALPNVEPAEPPEWMDYEMWLGPAPYTPYNKLKCSYNWYFIYDYCAGWIQSWGVHHCDIALWGAPELLAGPLEVAGTATFPTDGLANTSVTWRIEYTTRRGLVFSFSDNKHHPQGCRFIGKKGWVHVRRGGIQSDPPELIKTPIKPGDEHLYVSNNHHGNFVECIRSRRDCVAPVEAGHAATAITLVGDIATRVGRKLTWDWKAERFVNDEAANRMLSRAMRPPWSM